MPSESSHRYSLRHDISSDIMPSGAEAWLRRLFFGIIMKDITESLEVIREQVGGNGARMLLSLLGIRLQQMGAWSRGAQDRPLRQVLAEYPELCEVRGEDVIFRDGTSRSGSPRRFLRQDLFLAISIPRESATAWLDLETLKVLEVPQEDDNPQGPPHDEPLRYIQVPTLPLSEAQAFFREFLRDREPPAMIEALLETGGGWQSASENLIPGSHQALRIAFNQWVVDRAIEWLERHAIDVARFVKIAPARLSARSREPARSNDPSIDSLRARLHKCIDLMEPQELERLAIPARLLLLA